MGKIAITGGAGGITSDDVTATRNHVIKGYTTITSDSDDEVVQGTIEDRGVGGVDSFLQAREDGHRKIAVCFKNGYYHRENHPHESYVYLTYDQIKNLFPLENGKFIANHVGEKIEAVIVDPSDARMGVVKVKTDWIDKTFVEANKILSIQLWGLIPSQIAIGRHIGQYDGYGGKYIRGTYKGEGNATQGDVLAGVRFSSANLSNAVGTMARWVCTTGDVISAWNNEGFAWDDGYAGRGRGIVAKIPNNYRIENANWVFLSSPNLQPWNIRAGVNINNVIGTMQDYGAGRVAFNGATFDGVLVSGVANLIGYRRRPNGYNTYADYTWGGNFYDSKYDKFWHTGNLSWNVEFRSRTFMGNISDTKTPGVWFTNSINLTPFRKIILDFESVRHNEIHREAHIHARFYAIRTDLVITPPHNALVWVGNSDNATAHKHFRNYNSDYNNADDRNTEVQGAYRLYFAQNVSRVSGRMEIDVSAKNGHFYILIGVSEAWVDSYHSSGTFMVKRVEFQN